MSSSNRVRITFIEETTYGQTPGAGNFQTARFTSDSLSGTPETAQSQQLRTDRQSSGQIVTGLTVGGAINGELAKEDAVDSFIESAMYSTFTSDTPVAADLDIDATLLTLTRAAGDWNADLVKGDIITLTGFTNSENNTQVQVTNIQSATVVDIMAPSDIITESQTGNTFAVADKIETGTIKKSFSIEKAFLDLTDRAINYKGKIVNSWNLNVAFGEIANQTFEFLGNFTQAVDQAADFITDGRTIDPAATTQSMNGSIDLAFIGNGSSGTFETTGLCIQSLSLTLNNNLTPQNCIGNEAPQDYSEGEASIEVSFDAILDDPAWDALKKKRTQESFELGFIVKNADGFYGFYMPAVQVSGDDPGAAGLNQDVIVSFTGVAKIGPNQENSFRVFKG
jgi:hypothetical protein